MSGILIEALKLFFKEPYRGKHFWWETWIRYERLIVVCIATFLIDPVIRLCSLFLMFMFYCSF